MKLFILLIAVNAFGFLAFASELKQITVPNTTSPVQVTAISNDGNFVVGSYRDTATSRFRAFRKNVATGAVDTILPAAGFDESFANDISGDGAVVVGRSNNQATGIYRGFIWFAGGSNVPTSLPNAPAGYESTEANAISLDGTVLAITHYNPTPNKASVAMFPGPGGNSYLALPSSDGSNTFSRAYGIASDGSGTYGDRFDATNLTRPCVWVKANQTSGYSDSLGGAVKDASDNPIFVGNIVISGTNRPCYWKPLAGGNFNFTRSIIPPLNGAATGIATKITRSGTKIFGALGSSCFVWTEANGTRDLLASATDSGIETSGWSLRAVTDISSDGTRIVGDGFFNGTSVRYLLDLRIATPLQIRPAALVVISGEVGKTYQLQSSPSIGAPVWTNVGSSVAGSGVNIEHFEEVTTQQFFYRYLISPP